MDARERIIRQKIEAMLGVGDVLEIVGKWDEEIELLKKGIELCKNISKTKECQLKSQLAQVYLKKGNYDIAMELSQYVADTLKDEEGRITYGYGKAFNDMGSLYHLKGDYDKAMECYEISKKISEKIGDKIGYGMTVGNAGIVYAAKGDYDKAMECHETQKKLSEEIGDKMGYAAAVGKIGDVFYYKGDYHKVIECYDIYKNICEEMGDMMGYSIVVGNMGSVYHLKGEYEKAMECYGRAITGHEEIGFKYGLTYWFEGKANCLFEQEQFSEAWKFADKCVKLSTEISKPDTCFNGKVLQAKIDFELGEQAQGITILLEMLAETGDEEQQATLHYELWKMETGDRKQKHRQKALELYQKLYKKTPNFEYKKQIEELQGDRMSG